jgi:hypothetical protein
MKPMRLVYKLRKITALYVLIEFAYKSHKKVGRWRARHSDD